MRLLFTLAVFCVVSATAQARGFIQCGIPVGFPSFWKTFSEWSLRMDGFRDHVNEYAYWISPEPQFNGIWGPQCGRTDSHVKNVFVSEFTARAGSEYFIEFLADNKGTLRLWKNFDPKQEALTLSAENFFIARTVHLDPGTYAVIIEHRDLGDFGGASAVAAHISLRGKMVHRTFPDSTMWSVFQFPHGRDVKHLASDLEFLALQRR